MKPGYKTTEFWVTSLATAGALIGSLSGLLPGNAGVIGAAIAAGCYAISRGLVKLTNDMGKDI